MITQVFRGPHSLYRRYQPFIESTIVAIGLASLIMLALSSLPVYPYNWVIVIGVAIAIAALRWPLVAYFIAVAVMVYPIYTINLYLAVLFVAIMALAHRPLSHYLGATVLVLATPVLAEYHLHWLVPILCGLWWGGMAGAWIGGLAAIWGKFLGGMAGLNMDWLVLAGQSLDTQTIISRFQDANSLETLLLLVEPFAGDSSVILYNLLQVLGWAIAGGFVGALTGYKWVKYRTPWSILVVTAGGGLIMMATHLGLPQWLQEAVSEEAGLVLQDPTGPLFSLLVVIIVGTTIHSLRESLDLPVAPRRKFWKRKPKASPAQARKIQPFRFLKRSAQSSRKGQEQEQQAVKEETEKDQTIADDLKQPRQPVPVPHYSELPEWEPPQDDSGLIMLEID